jgi:hypothetical protein
MPGQQGFYYGGYPWKDFGVLTAKDLNAAIQLALSPISIIPPGSITNVMLANPWVQIGTTQINLGSAVNTLNGLHDPVNDLDVANKHYVDQRTGGSGSGGGISDAPADGTSYGRNNAAWVNVVPLAGGVTVTGTLGIGGALNANAGLNVTGGNLAVGTSGAQRNIGLFGMLLSSNNATPSLPNNSGSTASSGLRAQLADASGAMLGIGSNGVSGWWLNVTNITDLSQRYPLLLQPLGGDTRMGGNATVGGTLNVTGSTTVGPLIVNGNIAGQTLGLTTPLAVTSGGTGSGALALPPVMPGYGAWAGVLLVSNGSQVVTSNINQGYVATQGAGYVDLVSAGAGPAGRWRLRPRSRPTTSSAPSILTAMTARSSPIPTRRRSNIRSGRLGRRPIARPASCGGRPSQTLPVPPTR